MSGRWGRRSNRAELIRRLERYWRIELANAGILPAIVLLSIVLGARPGLSTAVAIVPNVLLLGIGGLYWRAKLHRITGRPGTMASLLPTVERLRWPVLVLTAAAVLVTAGAVAGPVPSPGPSDRGMAVALTILAVLEYINYYHRQLQHFDHGPDLRRLLTGRGFRRSRMAVDLARHRRRPDRTIRSKS